MRDDFDAVVAHQFKFLDDVPIPDTWGRVLGSGPASDASRRTFFAEIEGGSNGGRESPVPTEPRELRRKHSMRGLVVGLLGAAAVVASVLVVRDWDADLAVQTVPTLPPPRALYGTPYEELEPGTYYVDEVDGAPSARIVFTIGSGWRNAGGVTPTGPVDGWGLDRSGITDVYTPDDDVGFIYFSRPAQVYRDACYLDNGFYAGAVTTLEGLADALIDQSGFVDVTAVSDLSVDGYPAKTFQRTVPDVLTDCPNFRDGRMRLDEFGGNGLISWWSGDEGNTAGYYYEPGQFETLLLIDIDGDVIAINANLWAGTSEAERAEFAAVLDTIRIEPRTVPPTT